MARSVLLTIGEFEINGEKKKKRLKMGRMQSHEGGGESIALDAMAVGALVLAAQKAIADGNDTVWLSIFEDRDKQQGQQQANTQHQPQQQQPPQQSQQDYNNQYQ